jgi:hypothetical protein
MPDSTGPFTARCHLAQVGGVAGRLGRRSAAVWICDYPYPTMRLNGPSSDCSDCPVWRDMERARLTLEAPRKAS